MTPRSFAGRLQETIWASLQLRSGHAKPQHLSVKKVVDRRGVEPLTSAVQRRPKQSRQVTGEPKK